MKFTLPEGIPACPKWNSQLQNGYRPSIEEVFSKMTWIARLKGLLAPMAERE